MVTHLRGKPYEPPPAPYKPGQKLRIGGKTYRVIGSTHTHTQLEGVAKAVANWQISYMKKNSQGLEEILSSSQELFHNPEVDLMDRHMPPERL